MSTATTWQPDLWDAAEPDPWRWPRECQHCGKPFDKPPTGRRLYCSKLCRRRAQRLRKPDKPRGPRIRSTNDSGARVCISCCAPIDPGRGASALYCSTRCRSQTTRDRINPRTAPRASNCRECGKSMVQPEQGERMYCSVACRNERSRKERMKQRHDAVTARNRSRTCVVCGAALADNAHGAVRYCSKICANYGGNTSDAHIRGLQRRAAIGRKEAEWKRVRIGRTCRTCGADTSDLPGRGMFCSDECRRSPDARRRKYLQQKYKITPEQYDAVLEKQGHRCAICRCTNPKGATATWHVDHDHHTGTVRGLLCGRCNRGLGMYDDDPSVLRRAADYIDEYKATP